MVLFSGDKGLLCKTNPLICLIFREWAFSSVCYTARLNPKSTCIFDTSASFSFVTAGCRTDGKLFNHYLVHANDNSVTSRNRTDSIWKSHHIQEVELLFVNYASYHPQDAFDIPSGAPDKVIFNVKRILNRWLGISTLVKCYRFYNGHLRYCNLRSHWSQLRYFRPVF